MVTLTRIAIRVTVARKTDMLRFAIQSLAGDHHAYSIVELVTKFLAAAKPMPQADRPICLLCGCDGDVDFDPGAIVCVTPADAPERDETLEVPMAWLCHDCSAKGDEFAEAAMAKMLGAQVLHDGTETVQ